MIASSFFWSIFSVVVISVISFVGALSLLIREKWLAKVLIYLVSFSAGAMLGGAFFHLLPESLNESKDVLNVFVFLIIGLCLFFILEKVLRWHHCHDEACEVHQHLGWLNLVGDGIHNLIDGMIVFAAFSVSPVLGVPVVISIILHEIPQEMGDFGVLLYSGFSRRKALIYNFISALISLLGVFLAFGLSRFASAFSLEAFLLPFAAGGFIYIAASDLIPELHKEKKLVGSAASVLVFLAALVFMWGMKVMFG